MKPSSKSKVKPLITNLLILSILASVMLVAVYATDAPKGAETTSAIYNGNQDCGRVAFTLIQSSCINSSFESNILNRITCQNLQN